MTKQEFEDELKLDQEYEIRAEAHKEWELSNDYDKFVDYFAEDFEEVVVHLKRLKNLHHQYNHNFNILDLEDWM